MPNLQNKKFPIPITLTSSQRVEENGGPALQKGSLLLTSAMCMRHKRADDSPASGSVVLLAMQPSVKD